MACTAPSAATWRSRKHSWDDTKLASELERAWAGRPHMGPPYGSIHHDWTNFRTATLREARRRGLDISVTGF